MARVIVTRFSCEPQIEIVRDAAKKLVAAMQGTMAVRQ